MNQVSDRPDPALDETAGRHPLPAVDDVLGACRRAGLTVLEVPHGSLWGWLECATGLRKMTVQTHPADTMRHATQLMNFADSHAVHRARKPRTGAR